MLALDSPRWSQLTHAYGSAADVPAWLARLGQLPSYAGNAERWFRIWSALAQQGDVFASSYADVSHVVEALATGPERAHSSYVHFPAQVESRRAKDGWAIPCDVESSCFAALRRLSSLVARISARSLEPELLCCCMFALAVAQGQQAMAEAALERTSELATQHLQWFAER